jgi:hypothetical protein
MQNHVAKDMQQMAHPYRRSRADLAPADRYTDPQSNPSDNFMQLTGLHDD